MDNNLLNITRIVDCIEAHLEDKLDLESLAHEARYSKCIGRNVSDELLERQIKGEIAAQEMAAELESIRNSQQATIGPKMLNRI